MNSRSKIIIILAGFTLAIWWFWPSPSTPVTIENSARTAESSGPILDASRNPPTAIEPATLSPFSKGAAIQPAGAETAATIRKALKAAGLRTPDRYYAMGYKELRSLADQGNIYAQIQLGARYIFTNSALEYDPDYDFSKIPKVEAFKLFSQVALRGNASAVEMLSTKLADIDPVEAYSWKLLSAASSGESQREFYKQNQYNFQLDAADIAKARIRSQQLMQQMMSLPPLSLPAE
ncbi:hypothetical protein GJ698_02210 [Pseudoduganella sp. FT26W]|uniref:Sel1 repeat family protein n=1 Tax=Duganella aquatilis TaxID=2666082 RepID=A0A844CRJ9_9BURK|nr:hypothetical protein [Duganella aquatilis]MRW82903.1 hypothetical protein [Duganella aquatilis]